MRYKNTMWAEPTRRGEATIRAELGRRDKVTIVNPPTIFFFKIREIVYKLPPNSDDWLDALFLGTLAQRVALQIIFFLRFALLFQIL
jgi:hypothetical protein